MYSHTGCLEPPDVLSVGDTDARRKTGKKNNNAFLNKKTCELKKIALLRRCGFKLRLNFQQFDKKLKRVIFIDISIYIFL